MFDVGAATEDALEVDPAALDVDPHVKEGVDAVQLVLPRLRLLLKLLHTTHSRAGYTWLATMLTRFTTIIKYISDKTSSIYIYIYIHKIQ